MQLLWEKGAGAMNDRQGNLGCSHTRKVGEGWRTLGLLPSFVIHKTGFGSDILEESVAMISGTDVSWNFLSVQKSNRVVFTLLLKEKTGVSGWQRVTVCFAMTLHVTSIR